MQRNMQDEERRRKVDVLRAMVTLLVLMAYLGDYVRSVTLEGVRGYFAIAGLVVFVLVSAYALDLGNGRVRSGMDFLRFVKKRVLRVYPLHIPSVLLSQLR